MKLSLEELALCMAALEASAKDLREGYAASVRLGHMFPTGVDPLKIAIDMDVLRSRIDAHGQTTTTTPEKTAK